MTKKSTNDSTTSNDDPPVIFVKTYDNEKLYIKVPSKSNFGSLISCLVIWQALKPQGLVKKWYSENQVETSNNSLDLHELLVCRFKVYGPIPNKSKNLNIVPGIKAPVYHPKIDQQNDFLNIDANTNQADVHEGWFYAMGVLKSNGMLNFITENDGTLLYSIDMKLIMSSEIRELHHSIFDSSNVLFIGQLKELRFNNVIKTTSTLSIDQYVSTFLVRDGKTLPNSQRILIEFPLHIDLEDWFVGLNYFAKREYIGSYLATLKLTKEIKSPTSPYIPSNPNTTVNSESSNSSAPNGGHSPKLGSFPLLNPLTDYHRESFRVSKKVFIDIIEAKFDNVVPSTGKIYAEVRMWGFPWSRTAIVPHTSNPFWKEEFATDLPISTQMIHILIKKCSFSDSSYLSGDKLIGTVYVTPDILTKQVHTSSTIMLGSGSGNLINVNGMHNPNNVSVSTIPGLTHQPPTISNINNDIVRLSIYDSSNLPIGKLLLNVRLKEYHILSPNNFKTLEKMLMNAPMKDLIKFCNENVPTSEFEYVSLIMLDIFQSLGIEDQWFKSLMEVELVNVDKMTRKNYVTNKRNSDANKRNSENVPTSSSNNVFNTLFRGSSIFSKSLEKYNLRIGQEYLEKVFGDFFAKITRERKNCEVDPRYVSLQERAISKGKTWDDTGDSGDDDDDEEETDSDDYDSDEEHDREARVKAMVEQNFKNLYGYAEEIWNKIYITSNDLPQQIKLQLKNFRTKVELACDPEDKTTALNCLSAFIFLRFFCPAILNPKLFYLTKNHQTGFTQRTLTLIAKILLNLANRLEFSPHKEPHLVKMNIFLTKHQSEIFEYFDKITGRKNDFNEKILDLSHEVKRFDLGLSGDSTSSELPTTPYLIDKYLRLTELINLLDYSKLRSVASPVTSPMNDNITSNSSIITTSSVNAQTIIPQSHLQLPLQAQLQHLSISTTSSNNQQFDQQLLGADGSNFDIRINDERNVYQIGSLEFEKSEFLDLVGDNETEGFIKSLCRSNENIFSFITSNITLKDLQLQSMQLVTKIQKLETYLESCEFPNNYLSVNHYHANSINNHKQSTTGVHSNSSTDSANNSTSTAGNNNEKVWVLWEGFTNDVLSRSYLDVTRNCLVLIDKDIAPGNGYKKLVEQNALNGLKLKFVVDLHADFVNGNATSQGSNNSGPNSSISLSFSNGSLGSVIKTQTKNPFKKWLRKA